METAKLVVHKRDQAGKGVARRLRRAGQLPAVLYGNGTTLAIALVEKDLVHIRQAESGENTILGVTIEGDTPESCQAILREVQIDPVSRALLHADFYRVDMNKTITVMVPLTFTNEPHNLLQSANAVLAHLWREIEVTCLPGDIPDEIVVDLADIHPGVTFKAGALVFPPGVTLEINAEEGIVTAHVEVEREAPTESSAEAEEAS